MRKRTKKKMKIMIKNQKKFRRILALSMLKARVLKSFKKRFHVFVKKTKIFQTPILHSQLKKNVNLTNLFKPNSKNSFLNNNKINKSIKKLIRPIQLLKLILMNYSTMKSNQYHQEFQKKTKKMLILRSCLMILYYQMNFFQQTTRTNRKKFSD